MPVRQSRWTREEVDHLVDRRRGVSPRYELVNGELLVTPAPTHRHQRVLQLAMRLQPYLVRHGLGELFLGPAVLELGSGDRAEPDLFVISAIEGRRPAMTDAPMSPLLICESLSPSSARHDRLTKRRSFQRNAVPASWIIDADARAFEVWHPVDERPAVVDERLVWRPGDVTEAFELDIQRFFDSIEDGTLLG